MAGSAPEVISLPFLDEDDENGEVQVQVLGLSAAACDAADDAVNPWDCGDGDGPHAACLRASVVWHDLPTLSALAAVDSRCRSLADGAARLLLLRHLPRPGPVPQQLATSGGGAPSWIMALASFRRAIRRVAEVDAFGVVRSPHELTTAAWGVMRRDDLRSWHHSLAVAIFSDYLEDGTEVVHNRYLPVEEWELSADPVGDLSSESDSSESDSGEEPRPPRPRPQSQGPCFFVGRCLRLVSGIYEMDRTPGSRYNDGPDQFKAYAPGEVDEFREYPCPRGWLTLNEVLQCVLDCERYYRLKVGAHGLGNSYHQIVTNLDFVVGEGTPLENVDFEHTRLESLDESGGRGDCPLHFVTGWGS